MVTWEPSPEEDGGTRRPAFDCQEFRLPGGSQGVLQNHEPWINCWKLLLQNVMS